MAERSVLRLSGERALRKCEHWQAVAVAACEQSGRARVPQVLPMLPLRQWLDHVPPAQVRWLLSLQPGARPLNTQAAALQAMLAADAHAAVAVCTLSGPEGGLGSDEERLAAQRGFIAVDLGPRVLRAETAPLAVLAWLALQAGGDPPSKGG
jgi:16S rRNA (uracil1498-N3)-methyltransferase